MHINELSIENIGCIKKLNLKFNDKFNVICGANGIGKKIILKIISNHFSNGSTNNTKNFKSTFGQYSIYFTFNKQKVNASSLVSKKNSNSWYNLKFRKTGKLYAKSITSRSLRYHINDYMSTNIDSSHYMIDLIDRSTINYWSPDPWFMIYSTAINENNGFSSVKQANYELAKSVFGILDKSISIKTMSKDNRNIILSTPNGDIPFEFSPYNYKICIYIIMKIIQEIEFHFVNKPICIKDFDGCVLIDEIEEHLHPTWQTRLVNALKEIFPKTQFIVTTHSPSILQTLDKNEIIPLYLDETNQTSIKPLNLGEYGLQGWTLEEILKDVMGMPSTTSTLYSSTMKKFNKAMNEEDQEEILKQYHLLLQMLHPNNPLRRLLQIQVAEWEE